MRPSPKSCPFCDRPLARGQAECPYCGEDLPVGPWRRTARALCPALGLALLLASFLIRMRRGELCAGGSTSAFRLASWAVALMVLLLAEARRHVCSPGMPEGRARAPAEGPKRLLEDAPLPLRPATRVLACFLPWAAAAILAAPPGPWGARLCAAFFAVPFCGCVVACELPYALLFLPPVFLIPAFV